MKSVMDIQRKTIEKAQKAMDDIKDQASDDVKAQAELKAQRDKVHDARK